MCSSFPCSCFFFLYFVKNICRYAACVYLPKRTMWVPRLFSLKKKEIKKNLDVCNDVAAALTIIVQQVPVHISEPISKHTKNKKKKERRWGLFYLFILRHLFTSLFSWLPHVPRRPPPQSNGWKTDPCNQQQQQQQQQLIKS